MLWRKNHGSCESAKTVIKTGREKLGGVRWGLDGVLSNKITFGTSEVFLEPELGRKL